MKKTCKILFVFLIIFNIYSMVCSNYVYAGDIWTTGNKFLNTGASQGGGTVTSTMKNNFGSIFGFFWGIGLLVIVVSTVVLGIKYMTVSPNEKSRIKQATTPYIIGVVVIFGAITIWQLIINILEGSMRGV